MQINRLIEIMVLLLNKNMVTAKELAERFQVSTRTIYRDIEVLSSSGIPVYMSKGKGGGISILDEYSINKTILSDSDKQSLIVALKTLQSIEYPEVISVIDKISFMFNEGELENWVEIDFSRWGSNFNEDDKFTYIKNAILNNKLIKFSYLNSIAIESTRVIEPMKLIYKGQSWYLYGYCRLKEDFRLFRISRIKEVELLNEGFIRRGQEEVESNNVQQNIKLIKLRLIFNKEALYRILDEFDSKDVVDKGNDIYEVRVELPESEWIYGYILSFGSNVEVIEPAHIRDSVSERLEKMMKIYSS
ncbi:Proteasome accessory factor C [uncultured Clostridium sp.]|uniref:helix-turn-helix transcriptional regulator n=1 Tax=uncultured Clostridium sp. TaxID=59620 RepID=UPI0008234BC2|nr:YafY family protein [uncultured Clostridium sp.]SCJ93724.1 Proteasome accessory factor C [uncultured Clostridium sp.]